MTSGDSRPTVVFFRTAYETMGGGSQMLLRLLNGLDGNEYRLIMLTQKRDEVAQRAEELGVELVVVPYRGALDTYDEDLLDAPLSTKLRAGLRLLQFDAEARKTLSEADVLWIDGIRSYLTLLPYILLARPTVIWNIGLLRESEGMMSIFHEIAFRTTTCVFIESEHQAKSNFSVRQYEKFGNKFVVFHKGIDTETFTPSASNSNSDPGSNSNPVRIGTASLIHPRKGLDDLIEAFDALDREDVELHVAGEPTREESRKYFDRLKSMVEKRDLDVTFHGWVDDMPSFYESLDVFVLASYNEGIPGTVREAMAMELPVVATDVGGTADVVDSDETGFLVEPGNVDGITNAIGALLDDPERRNRMGVAGRERIVDEFSVEQYVRKYDRLLSHLAKR